MHNPGERLIILPGDIEFEQTLATPPPDWRQIANKTNGSYAFIADAESGLLRTVDGRGCQEYLLGGEYIQRLESLYEDEDDYLGEDLEGVEELYIDW
ncbi:hypothetical protein [Gloeocapsopsis sp. IPPAS B-1203]|uniref:hypothetical protein n=1 Tax=Gloeocapsopsis sp. IPPAS B-1203 TaxID=2049454 RepID=UPI000C176296|nr:hypothetical protein [Gloeocapsopsis sp. IPPAS B-1203]PIG90821.1 hypothetical protein CSQ79_24550 [Gloeocapsopsis sp. IPPAS B-1203]